MSVKKSIKKARGPFTQKVTSSVSPNGVKRYTHWLCAPGNVCLPTEEEPIFTQSPQWKIFRIMAEFIEGFEFLSKLKREVSIFGSARATVDDLNYKLARDLGFALGKKGYTVVTGGGPGIMQAANHGAYEAGGESVGLNIQLATEQRINEYVKKGMGFHYFFTRKVMLSASAQAYVFFPGGFGTLDEMTEMATLVQTGKIPRTVPIILFGKDFWAPFEKWLHDVIEIEDRYIEEEDFVLLHVVDTVAEAMKIIDKTFEREFA